LLWGLALFPLFELFELFALFAVFPLFELAAGVVEDVPGPGVEPWFPGGGGAGEGGAEPWFPGGGASEPWFPGGGVAGEGVAEPWLAGTVTGAAGSWLELALGPVIVSRRPYPATVEAVPMPSSIPIFFKSGPHAALLLGAAPIFGLR
jgi:hypothetical protein